MKKVFVSVMSLVLALSMAACGAKGAEETVGGDPRTWGPAEETTAAVSDDKDTLGGEDVQIPNPWQECASLEEAGKLAGFSFTAPESVDGYTEKYIAAIENALAEVIFSKGDNDDASPYFRKGLGTEDISGDYNTYDTVEQQTIGGKTVTCKGNDGLIYNATWNDGTYSYAVMSNAGMSAEQLALPDDRGVLLVCLEASGTAGSGAGNAGGVPDRNRGQPGGPVPKDRPPVGGTDGSPLCGRAYGICVLLGEYG